MKNKYKKIGDITTRVMEECAEVVHILCKVQRFGWDNYHPLDKSKTKNKVLVLREISDLEKTIKELKGSLII